MVLLQLAGADDASLTFQPCTSACTGRCVSHSLAVGPWAVSTPQPCTEQPVQPGCARLSHRPRLATNHCGGKGVGVLLLPPAPAHAAEVFALPVATLLVTDTNERSYLLSSLWSRKFWILICCCFYMKSCHCR